MTQQDDHAQHAEGADMDRPHNRRGDDRADAMLFAHERRIYRLEQGHESLQKCIADMKFEQHRQTELTAKIARDTQDIRDALAGAKVFGRIAGWIGGVTAAIVSGYALYSIFRGWPT